MILDAPSLADSRHAWKPMPVFAPVTMMVLPAKLVVGSAGSFIHLSYMNLSTPSLILEDGTRSRLREASRKTEDELQIGSDYKRTHYRADGMDR